MELAVSSAGELFVFLERDAGFFGMGRHYNGRKRSPSSHDGDRRFRLYVRTMVWRAETTRTVVNESNLL